MLQMDLGRLVVSKKEQSIISQVIKILRITNEPLSAHAISEIYSLSYSRVKKVLKELEADELITSIRTNRGTFYFIPDKYLRRQNNMLESQEVVPFIFYEDFTDKELKIRKKNIEKFIKKLNSSFDKGDIKGEEYFQQYIEKNEELTVIEQIIRDRKEDKSRVCIICKAELAEDAKICESCRNKVPECFVCKRPIDRKGRVKACPFCKQKYHAPHILEWLKVKGNCPKCKKKVLENELVELGDKK